VTDRSAARLDEVLVTVEGGRRILGPVSVAIGRGERWVLLGPNGGGKTTLLSVAGAWRHPSAGTAWVLGERLGRADVRRLRARIGHVGHTVVDRLRPAITLGELVRTGRSSALEPWWLEPAVAEVRELLARVGLAGMEGRRLGTCSQGERQRALLARALAGGKELLLLDEPAAGLDLPGREAMLTALVEAVPAGTALVMATHHLEEVPPSATHAALVAGGRLVAAGPIDEVLTDERLSRCFGVAVRVVRADGRWWARGSRA
jgi:iron complex transport system ATP-binding protein